MTRLLLNRNWLTLTDAASRPTWARVSDWALAMGLITRTLLRLRAKLGNVEKNVSSAVSKSVWHVMKRPTLLRTIGVSVFGENTILHTMMITIAKIAIMLERVMAVIFRARFIKVES